MKIITVIPAFNESTTIGGVIEDVRKYVDEVIVVDDGSTDTTAQSARDAGAYVYEHVINRGQGAALQTGTDAALRRDADVIIHFDADGQMDARDIPKLVNELIMSGYDVVLGSRFLSGAVGMPVLRKIAKRGARLFHWLITGVRLSDVHCGFRVLRRTAARKIILSQDRMAHATEIEAEIGRCGLRYREYPVHVQYTTYARSKSLPAFTHAWQVLRDLVIGKVVKKGARVR